MRDDQVIELGSTVRCPTCGCLAYVVEMEGDLGLVQCPTCACAQREERSSE